MNFPARLLRTTGAGAGALLVASATLAAQQAPQDTSKKVPLKQVAPVEARSSRGLSAISMLRALPNGSVYVNDNQRRQMLLLDPTLKDIRVIADTAPGAPLPYGQRPAGLLAYVADSTIIVDPSTSALVVLNGQGKVSRIMAPPTLDPTRSTRVDSWSIARATRAVVQDSRRCLARAMIAAVDAAGSQAASPAVSKDVAARSPRSRGAVATVVVTADLVGRRVADLAVVDSAVGPADAGISRCSPIRCPSFA
jgi:hypothetical protein